MIGVTGASYEGAQASTKVHKTVTQPLTKRATSHHHGPRSDRGLAHGRAVATEHLCVRLLRARAAATSHLRRFASRDFAEGDAAGSRERFSADFGEDGAALSL